MGRNANCPRNLNFREIDFCFGRFLLLWLSKKGFTFAKEVQDINESFPTEQR